MWSGGLNVPKNSDGVEQLRDAQLQYGQESVEKNEAVNKANQDVGKASDNVTEAGTDYNQAMGDKNSAEADTEGYKKSVQSAQDGELEWRHQMEEQQSQLDSQWKEWQSSKDLADTKQSIFDHQLRSFYQKEVAAFLDEARQREAEIARMMHALQMKMAAAGNPEVSKSSAGASTELSFAVYARMEGLPTNEAISYLENVKSEYAKLAERGRMLAERSADTFYKDKINEQVARLEKAQAELSDAQSKLATAESKKKAAKAAYDSAVDTYQSKQREAGEVRQKAQEAEASLNQYATVKQQEALEEQRKQQKKQQQQQPAQQPAGAGA